MLQQTVKNISTDGKVMSKLTVSYFLEHGVYYILVQRLRPLSTLTNLVTWAFKSQE